MTCNNKDIGKHIPAYLTQELEPAEQRILEEHLESCSDCKMEVILLRTLATENVPDPGEAFWKETPGIIYRAVQREMTRKKYFNLSWFAGEITLPRWVLTAETVCGALVILFLTILSVQHRQDAPLSQAYVFSEDTMNSGSINVTALSQDDIETINTWAGGELASIAQEAEPVIASNRDTDIYEELASLNASEIDALSHTIENWKEEG
jgi:hypothetical protein